MIGTILNVAGILIGGILGLTRRKPLSPAIESNFRVVLGAFTVFYGLRLTWLSLGGTLFEILKQIVILVLSLMLGKILGRALRLQKFSNKIGQRAREQMSSANISKPDRLNTGFRMCAALFCAAPLGILGASQEGLSPGYFYPLAIKAVMDGLASISFAMLFGGGVILSAIPVLALQGSITMISQRVLAPFLAAHNLVNSINTVGGLLVFCVALVVLNLKRIELADYLPALLVAPVVTFWWK